MQCYICFEDKIDESSAVACRGHEFHQACLESWLQFKKVSEHSALQKCPVCDKRMRVGGATVAELKADLRKAIMGDYWFWFKNVLENLLSHEYTLLEIFHLATEHQSWAILKGLKTLTVFSFGDLKDVYAEILDKPTLASVRWLLDDFTFPESRQVRTRTELLDLLMDRYKYYEVYYIYIDCFPILTREEQIYLGKWLCSDFIWALLRIPLSRLWLFDLVCHKNLGQERYVFTVIYPICLSNDPDSSRLCPNCGSMHSIEAIIGAVRWNNLYFLDHLLKCCINHGVKFRQHYKIIIRNITQSKLRTEIIDIFNAYPQFSRSLTWRLRLAMK